jgi:hypothetical protein
MPPESFLHGRNDFKELIQTVAHSEQIHDPALVEKDYWIMHALFGLKLLGLTFQLKGGTSLSKGFGVIDRFSEDIDVRIEPFDGLNFDENPNHNKPQHIDSRRKFFDKLQQKIKIPGITAVERDPTYGTKTMRNAGLRLRYESLFDPIPGLKDGVLLEVGSDQTSPYRAVTISSWIVDFEGTRKLNYTDNRAVEIPCYNPEYTFVEKLQTVIHKYRQFEREDKLPSDLLRHYYDIHRLLDLPEVQKFIGTPEYLEHKRKRFKSLDQNVAESAAFSLYNEKIRNQFETEYKKTAALYYRGQIPLDKILARIQKDLPRL